MTKVTSVFEINDRSPIIDSHQLRLICGAPANNSWTRWRKLAKAPERARSLTLRKALLIWVAANLYRNGKRKLTFIALNDYANELLGKQPGAIAMLQKLCGCEGLTGIQLTDAAEVMLGKRVSERTLYRKCKAGKVPQYSRTAVYRPEQVRRVMRAIAS